LIIGLLQALFLLCMAVSGSYFGLGPWFYGGLLIAAGMFGYQQILIADREREKCFRAFLHNNKVGLMVLGATVVDLWVV
ncbi:MAG: 4-hydroxybenzoate octaprenyltransferase, partial [Pseudomonadales bacterium]|nr:4-hydroxybenzoate octaprenyltransferase [Pseudomonadales bacterium]